MLDVTDGAIERAVVGPRKDRYFELNLRDPEHRERSGGRPVESRTPGRDPFRRPERLIWRAGGLRADPGCRELLQSVARVDASADLERTPPDHSGQAKCPERALPKM